MFARTVEKVGSMALIRGSMVGSLFRVVDIRWRTAEIEVIGSVGRVCVGAAWT